MQHPENNDQVPHLVIQSDEEIYQKLQELKEKVVNLKESNRIIESRLDVLCRGVGDREQTQCPECKRQKEDEAGVLKELQEKAKTLEEQERHQEDEMKKLGESLKTVMTNFDKLTEITQARKITSQSGHKSKWDQEDFATVYSETKRVGRFEHEGSSSQDITQTDCAQLVSIDNCDDEHRLGSCSDNQTQSTHIKQELSTKCDNGQNNISLVNNLSGKADEKNMDHADIRDKKCPNTNMGHESDHPVHKRTASQGEGHQVAEVQGTKIAQTEKRNELVDQSTNLQIVGRLTEDVGHSSRDRGTDSVIASVSEIHEIQIPGPQQTVNQLTKVSNSVKNSDRRLKVEITGDSFQEAVQPIKDAKAVDAVENIVSENGSIKNPNFQRKTQNSGSKESQQHQQFDERRKDGHTDTTPASTDDLDQHAQIVRVPDAGYWAALAQEELDIARERKVGELHTVLCVDTSASMRQGSAWVQTKQFFNQFISGLEEVTKEFNITQEYVAISVFGKEVKVIKRLTNDFSALRQAFGTLKVGGPSVMYGGLLMALAGVGDNTHTATAAGVRVLHRIILISDGRPTDPLLASGPDVYNAEEKQLNQMAVLEAVQNISARKIRIHCVPVGDANVTFLETISSISDGKVFSVEDGRKLARKTINTLNAGFLLNHWKMMNALQLKMMSVIHTKFTLEDAMLAISYNKELQFLDPFVSRITSLSNEDRAEVLEIAQQAINEDLLTEGEDAMEKYHYEFDDPDVKLPPLGSRVRRGPDWDKDLQDEDGPGTILGHHKDMRQVCVEWDRNGNMNFYRYGDMGKYDVVIVDEPRFLDYNDLILTGCYVKRGKDWMYGNQDGTPDAVGVVLKVLEDGRVVVRWPDKSKHIYRFGSEGFFDLEVCNPFDGQAGGGAKPVTQSVSEPVASEPSKNKNAPKKNKNS